MTEPLQTPLTPTVVLGIAAHPDDLDYTAAGTMAAFAKQGAQVYYLVLTDGGKGSDDRDMTSEKLRDIRRAEQRAAAQVTGAKDVFFLDYPDGTLENTQELKRDIVKVIRQVKPDVVVGIDPTVLYNAKYRLVNHPDHLAAGLATLAAVYPLARDHMTFPELAAQGFEPHKTQTLLLLSFDLDPERANYAVDISDTLDIKFRAIAAHATQFNAEALQPHLTDMATQAGEKFGFAYAEPFVRVDMD
ncbi:MAG TPA: PIG-L deacetylase family protein [Candidatus Saccharimonadales bacterium]|nr:PIG-L deacetylase family protein [Candidatus Saccharimonadales bacterium]